MVERYDEGYDWRYVVRSAHGRNAGANLDRRGEVWRYRWTLPADLRDRAGQTEIARGLGRIALAEALAEAAREQSDGLDESAQAAPNARPSLDATRPGSGRGVVVLGIEPTSRLLAGTATLSTQHTAELIPGFGRNTEGPWSQVLSANDNETFAARIALLDCVNHHMRLQAVVDQMSDGEKNTLNGMMKDIGAEDISQSFI